jgi:hypothetical protein
MSGGKQNKQKGSQHSIRPPKKDEEGPEPEANRKGIIAKYALNRNQEAV